jgi:hypothetical protein
MIAEEIRSKKERVDGKAIFVDIIVNKPTIKLRFFFYIYFQL